MNCTLSATGPRRRGPDPAETEDLAAAALAFLAEDPDRLADFFAATGLTATSLRAAAGEAGFSRGLLAYLAADEPLLLRFAQARQTDPARLAGMLQAAAGDEAYD